jgi:hypothetical protein
MAQEIFFAALERRTQYLFDFRRINIYFLFCRTNSVRDLIFCLIAYVVNHGRVGKYTMRKSKRYLFDFRRINIYFLFCRTNSVRDLIFV